MRRLLLLLCVVLGRYQTAAAAEDYSKAVDAAWCAGAFAKSIKGLRASGKALNLKFARSLEPSFNYYFAFAKGYFRENDALTSFILLGQEGFDECNRVTYRCESEYPVTSEDREMRTNRWKANIDCTNAACRRLNACLSDDALSGGAR
jgi:hypothetical protein